MSKHTDELLDAVHSIAEIIYMELPLRYQDAWLEDIKAKGIWKPEVEIDMGRNREIVYMTEDEI